MINGLLLLPCLFREKIGMLEHADPHSYSWMVLRYAIVRFVTRGLKIFLPQVGIEIGGNETYKNYYASVQQICHQVLTYFAYSLNLSRPSLYFFLNIIWSSYLSPVTYVNLNEHTHLSLFLPECHHIFHVTLWKYITVVHFFAHSLSDIIFCFSAIVYNR